MLISERCRRDCLAPGPADICVSIYLRTTLVTQETAGDRIELKNFAKDAVNRLEKNVANRRRVAALSEQLDDLESFDLGGSISSVA